MLNQPQLGAAAPTSTPTMMATTTTGRLRILLIVVRPSTDWRINLRSLRMGVPPSLRGGVVLGLRAAAVLELGCSSWCACRLLSVGLSVAACGLRLALPVGCALGILAS